MGGVIGAVSGKFVIVAAGLLVASRVGHERVNALIDPSLEHTEISRTLADRLDPKGPHRDGDLLTLRRGTTIGLGAKEFDAPELAVGSTHAPSGVDLVIGRDLLEAERLELDFERRQLSLVTPGEFRGTVRGWAQVPLTPAGPALWRMTARVEPGGQQDGVLDLASPLALTLGGQLRSSCPSIGFSAVWIKSASCDFAANFTLPFKVGLRFFAKTRVLLDLPNRSLWVAPPRSE